MPCAARLGDQVLHSQALPQAKSGWWHGLLKGALIGAAIVAVSAVAVAVTIGTGGFGAPFAIGAAAVIIGSGLRYAQVGFHEGAQAGSMQGTRAGPIKTGSRSVFINGKAAALACLSLVSCTQHGDGKRVAQGSQTVWINSHRLARVGDHGECGFVIGEGSLNVFAGAPPASCHGLTVGSEIPESLSKWVDRAGVIGGYMELAGGLLMGGSGLLKALTSVRGVLSLGFIGGMGYGGSRLATDYAKSHGWSASNQMMAGDFGGLGGSLVGGGMVAGGARAFGETPVEDASTTTVDTIQHVHEGGIVSDPQSPYNGKWDGKGIHDWDGLQNRVTQDGYKITNVQEDPSTGVRRVTVERSGNDPTIINKNQKIQDNPERYPDEVVRDPQVTGKISKTVYPKNMSASDIDTAGDQALDSAAQGDPGTKIESYGMKTRTDGSPADGYFEAPITTPDGKTIRVQGWFSQDASGSQTITSHAPTFDKNWPSVPPTDW